MPFRRVHFEASPHALQHLFESDWVWRQSSWQGTEKLGTKEQSPWATGCQSRRRGERESRHSLPWRPTYTGRSTTLGPQNSRRRC